MAKHHPLSASTSERWLNCPGSVELIKHAPASAFKATPESAEGTFLHKLTEEQLRGFLATGKVVEQPLGSKHTVDGFEFVLDNGHREAVRSAVNYVVGIIQKFKLDKKHVTLEERVTIPTNWEYHFPDDGMLAGMLDVKIVVVMNCLHIIDHKFGKGVKVDVIENPQLMYYALGAWLALPEKTRDSIEEIKLTVIQPRHYSGGTIESWTVEPEALSAFHDKISAAVDRILAKDFVLNPGDWCKWCPAKRAMLCEAYNKYALTIPGHADHDFAALIKPKTKALPAPSALTDDQLLAIVSKEKILIEFLETAKEEMVERLKTREIPGAGLKPKRSNFAYKDETTVIDFFERNQFPEDFYLSTEILSPAQLKDKITAWEKVNGKMLDINGAESACVDPEEMPFNLSDYTYKPDNGKTLFIEAEQKKP